MSEQPYEMDEFGNLLFQTAPVVLCGRSPGSDGASSGIVDVEVAKDARLSAVLPHGPWTEAWETHAMLCPKCHAQENCTERELLFTDMLGAFQAQRRAAAMN